MLCLRFWGCAGGAALHIRAFGGEQRKLQELQQTRCRTGSDMVNHTTDWHGAAAGTEVSSPCLLLSSPYRWSQRHWL